jgi:hypothetical protein
MSEHNTKSWWRQKKFFIPLLLVLLIVGARILLEPLLLKLANKQAQKINSEFKGQISELDLSILRGVIQLKNVTASLKSNDRKFLDIKNVFVDLAWSKLFQGEVQFDALISNLQLNYEKDMLAAIKNLPKPERKKELPFRLAELTFRDSRMVLNEYPGLNNQKALVINDINGVVKNISGKKDSPLGKYQFTAGLSKDNDVKVSGNFDISADPPRWDMNAKVDNFDLGAGNNYLSKLIPMNFKKGTLDLYAETKSENGKIYGYVKPFLNNVEFMGNKKEFEGGKHFFVEVLGAVSNFVFENSDRKSVATRVPFIYEDGAFSVEGGGAISDAIQHGLLENDLVERGIEQKYRLNKRNPAEVQAQEEDLEKAKEKNRGQ